METRTSAFQFTNPVLLNMQVDINRQFDPNKPVKLIPKLHIHVRKDEKKPEAIVELTVEIGGNDSSFPFFITATEGAKFKWDDQTSSIVDSLLNQNAPALLLGYIRSVIALVTSATPYSSYNIPFVDFTQQKIDD